MLCSRKISIDDINVNSTDSFKFIKKLEDYYLRKIQ